MGAPEIISSGEALSKLGVIGLLGVAVIALAYFSFRLWRDAKADSKEAAATYITLLKEQFSDAGRRKDLFDDLAKGLDGQAQATRDGRQDFAAFRQEFAAFRQEFAAFRSDMQRVSRP